MITALIICAHIEEMKKAVAIDGMDLMGYTPWGYIDLVSFTTGEMAKRCNSLGRGSALLRKRCHGSGAGI